MAIIHNTTLKPTKLELLTDWLPTRPWYRPGTGAPRLTRVGGFRLDDPEGEVGIEFMVTTDASAPEPVHYLVPLTYRGAPLDDADHALVGTMEHGVLGKRWAYDGVHDPVLLTQFLALFEGRAQAQAQSISDELDREVTRSYTGEGLTAAGVTVTEDMDATDVTLASGGSLRLHRVLRPVPDGSLTLPEDVAGHVSGTWGASDGRRERALFAVVRTDSQA
ncbi:hypothetical protein SGFS_054740 [Streptomyces graminofaciens]|uniref:Maltokinase N-terminal cap domain-containing protein n=1 Tax=Streptomyces graminofaciens TaxID=68212 RepID=A0ABM9SC45_9ACTN|nr:1,4-alpha-glucan branching protein [Streptomyces graminofaciens]BBC34180.1 hypothetical protein SGFS_054740 [Streptomyces graminofaciens]